MRSTKMPRVYLAARQRGRRVVDPWTHKGSEVPDIFPLEKWKAGD
jgi:hypothetical protein